MKEDYKKIHKKLTLIFLLNPVPFNGQSYQKQKGPGTSYQLLFKLQNKFIKIIRYLLSDQVWWCNTKRFSGYSKNYNCKFMQASSWHLSYSNSICPFESGKYGKEGEELQKIEYLKNEEVFRWNKKKFSQFLKAIIWWRDKKIDKKIVDTSFKTSFNFTVCRSMML